MHGGHPFTKVLPTEDWMRHGACAGLDPNIFFPPRKGHNNLSAPAIAICNSCIHRMRCLHYALDHKIDEGVWGGTTGKSRIRIRRALRLANEGLDRPESSHG